MKFGKSVKEIIAKRKEIMLYYEPFPFTKRVFAWIPKYCENTKRHVWLEYVSESWEWLLPDIFVGFGYEFYKEYTYREIVNEKI